MKHDISTHTHTHDIYYYKISKGVGGGGLVHELFQGKAQEKTLN